MERKRFLASLIGLPAVLKAWTLEYPSREPMAFCIGVDDYIEIPDHGDLTIEGEYPWLDVEVKGYAIWPRALSNREIVLASKELQDAVGSGDTLLLGRAVPGGTAWSAKDMVVVP